MQVRSYRHIADIDRVEWNALLDGDFPFLRHEFLAAAEASGSVSADSGWQPCHLALHDAAGQLTAAMPLYRKSHSWGEFVFDWAWARAYEQAGLHYYPKLVSATPFTPASGPRLLARSPASRAALIAAALELAAQLGDSSLHVQFAADADLPYLEAAGLRLRKDCQFHWHNDDYAGFDDFLAAFSSRKRKKVRQDRRYVVEQGLRFRRLRGDELGAADWDWIYALISNTFLQRGGLPYYNQTFFEELCRSLPNNILVIVAERAGQWVAASVFYCSADTLYGRYWGADGHYNALHFETCYYQGIDYCIEHGLRIFNPGTQGEHKISRGFLPVPTWSAHWLARPDFFSAVADYLDDEQRHVDRYIDAVDAHSPFRTAIDPAKAHKK